MTLRNALNELIDQLSNFESANLDALHILEQVTGRNNVHIFTNPEEPLTKEQEEKLFSIVSERKRNKPLAYIFGVENFLGIDFKVSEDTLIPRLDTEFIVNEAGKIIEKMEDPEPKILDLCCGSGIIGLCLKKFSPNIKVTLSDISAGALEVAKENSNNLNLKANVIQSDLFNLIRGKFHIIVSNPPYIPLKEYKELDKEIVDYEPKSALVADEDGYSFHRKIIEQSKNYLEENGWLLLECGYNQGNKIKKMLELEGFKNIEIINDFADYNRVVKAQL